MNCGREPRFNAMHNEPMVTHNAETVPFGRLEICQNQKSHKYQGDRARHRHTVERRAMHIDEQIRADVEPDDGQPDGTEVADGK